jgi:hypothetical protein
MEAAAQINVRENSLQTSHSPNEPVSNIRKIAAVAQIILSGLGGVLGLVIPILGIWSLDGIRDGVKTIRNETSEEGYESLYFTKTMVVDDGLIALIPVLGHAVALGGFLTRDVQ